MEKDRDRLDLYKEFDAAKDKKAFLERMTDVFEIQGMLIKWYQHFNPEKEDLSKFTEQILERYTTCEDVLFNRLYRKYVNPQWSEKSKLWFADCKRPLE